MSAIKLNSSGGGSITISPASTASTLTLTAPAQTGTIVAANAGGNIAIPTSNAGIIFNNSSALTNSTLNDYEAGTWTPTVTSLTGSITSYTSSGNYRKIGSLVNLNFVVSITNAGTAGGVMIISNLPFAMSGGNAAAGIMSENQTVGLSGSLVAASATTLYGKKYDGGNPIVTNYTWVCQISYPGPF